MIIDLVCAGGEVSGAVALHLASGAAVTIAAKATVLATGGLTRLYRRNSASANMGGDGYALALRAGAPLVDMEFVQFFPIGHLAPRLIGMDPIMWDPFRYKLGGRLLNSEGEEFAARYGVSEEGRYLTTRDVATYAILKEVEAGRGSPHGGAFLSFEHCPEQALRAAFGPVIDRLAKYNIDLTKTPIEVAPIAHYHMGGIMADERMATEVRGSAGGGRSRRGRERRQSTLGQCHHRGAGVRPAGGIERGGTRQATGRAAVPARCCAPRARASDRRAHPQHGQHCRHDRAPAGGHGE